MAERDPASGAAHGHDRHHPISGLRLFVIPAVADNWRGRALTSAEHFSGFVCAQSARALVKLARDRYLRFRTLMDGSRSTTNDGLFSLSPEAVVGKMAIGVSYLTHCRLGMATS